MHYTFNTWLFNMISQKFKRWVITEYPIRNPNNSWALSNEDKINVSTEYCSQVFTSASPDWWNRNSNFSWCCVPIITTNQSICVRKIKFSNLALGYDSVVREILKHLKKVIVLLKTIRIVCHDCAIISSMEICLHHNSHKIWCDY